MISRDYPAFSDLRLDGYLSESAERLTGSSGPRPSRRFLCSSINTLDDHRYLDHHKRPAPLPPRLPPRPPQQQPPTTPPTMPPLPHLKPHAKQTLDDLLHSTVKSHSTPAVFLGATNEREEVYWGCEGEKEFGEGGEEVTEDTGESARVGEGGGWGES